MIVTITENEIRHGAKGDYLYIKYITNEGKSSGKAIFSQLKDKWALCDKGYSVDLKLDKDYNVIDILPTQKVEKESLETKEQVPPTIDNKIRCMTLSYSKDLAVEGKIPIGYIGTFASQFERFCNGEIDGMQMDKNITMLFKEVPKSRLVEEAKKLNEIKEGG